MEESLEMSRSDWGLLLVLSVLWGGSFFFSKVAVEGLPPLTLVFFRFSATSILVFAYLLASRRNIPTHPAFWASFAVMGLLNNLVPASLIVWGQTMIPSGLASVLIATTPIFSMLATHCIGTSERLTRGKLVGMGFGLLGTIVLFRLDNSTGPKPSVTGIMACLGAAASYGVANAFGRRFQRLGITPVVGAFGQMTATSVLALPLSVIFSPGEPVVCDGVICTYMPAAASTAASALTMPAPQVVVVHTHSAGALGSV